MPPSTPKTPLIITAAITGGHRASTVGPAHPTTPRAIIADTLACASAGASVVHIHARLENGDTTMNPAAYREIACGVREAGCEVVLDFSAGDDGGRASHAERIAIVHSGADIVSFAGGSFNIGDRLYDNRPNFQRALAEEMARMQVRPEIEVFDTAHMRCVPILQNAGISAPFLFQFVVGLSGALRPDWHLIDLLRLEVPKGSHWSISAQTGDDIATHTALLTAAIHAGGHIRTGLEDIRSMNSGVLALSNAALVSQWIEVAERAGRPIASPSEARTYLGLPPQSPGAIEREYHKKNHQVRNDHGHIHETIVS